VPHPPFGQVCTNVARELFVVIASSLGGGTGGESGIPSRVDSKASQYWLSYSPSCTGKTLPCNG